MTPRIRCLFIVLLFPCCLIAQGDAWVGTWEMKYLPILSTDSALLQLKVAKGEKKILFPARLEIAYGNYVGSFELLLVRKNSRELAISKNKAPLLERPFALGQATFGFNGILDQTRDGKGNPLLVLNRIQPVSADSILVDTTLGKYDSLTYARLQTLLGAKAIRLKKIDHQPWEKDTGNTNLPAFFNAQNAYFGVLDSTAVPLRDVLITYAGARKPKDDQVSVALNGQVISEQVSIGKKDTHDEILLDTGLNLLAFFADNFGKQLPNTAKLQVKAGAKTMLLDFSVPRDSAASFIVAQLFIGTDKTKEKHFSYYSYGGSIPLLKDEHLLGSIISPSATITLGIIDDAVEDGDSISIQLNGKWVTEGFPVKKHAQFLKFQLQPGANTLVFKADNLGSIPPNTSIIEIIDGNRRKSFSMETSLGEKNLIRVLYDPGPGQ